MTPSIFVELPMISFPDFIDNDEQKKAFLFLEFYFREDNKTAETFAEVTSKAKLLIQLTADSKLAYDWLKVKVRGYLAQKKAAANHDEGYYYSRVSTRKNNHTTKNKSLKASHYQIETKVNLLEQLLDWLKEEKEDLLKKQPSQDNLLKCPNLKGTINLFKDRYLQLAGKDLKLPLIALKELGFINKRNQDYAFWEMWKREVNNNCRAYESMRKFKSLDDFRTQREDINKDFTSEIEQIEIIISELKEVNNIKV